jgi:hypothetical protein
MSVNEGRNRVHAATIASAGTSSNEVDLGGYFIRVMLEVPAGLVNDTRILVANTLGGTYRNLYTGFADNDTTPAVYNLASTVCNCVIAIPAPGRYIKVQATTAAADGELYTVVGIQ